MQLSELTPLHPMNIAKLICTTASVHLFFEHNSMHKQTFTILVSMFCSGQMLNQTTARLSEINLITIKMNLE